MSNVSGKPWHRTPLTEMLNISLPIVQAPMAGVTTPELVAAVSNSGGLGSHGAGMLSPERIVSDINEIRLLTAAPFNVNLFVLSPPIVKPDTLTEAMARLEPMREELGLPTAVVPGKFCESFSDQLEAVLEARPPVVSFTFGIVDAAVVERFRRVGTKVIGTATHVAEALAWESVGADAVCAQGAEAGGHRGTFLGGSEEAMIGTLALVPQIADAIRIPVIAAGGIMDGRGIAASLVLGAAGVQLGTAFLTCEESGIPAEWKDKLHIAEGNGTRMTRLFSGRHARGLINQFMDRLQEAEQRVPAYPIQNALTAEIRAAAKMKGRLEYVALWAGQGVPLVRHMAAAELIIQLGKETGTILGCYEITRPAFG